MTITPWELYWIFKMDDIHSSLLPYCLFIPLFTVCCFIVYAITVNSGDFKKENTIFKFASLFLLVVAFMVVLLKALLPTTEQMCAIKSIHKITNPYFIQNDMPQDAKKIYKLGKEYLKNKISEDKNENK